MLDLAPIKERCEIKLEKQAIGWRYGKDEWNGEIWQADKISLDDFIAHAQADIRALIAEVERLRAMLADTEQELEEIKGDLSK